MRFAELGVAPPGRCPGCQKGSAHLCSAGCPLARLTGRSLLGVPRSQRSPTVGVFMRLSAAAFAVLLPSMTFAQDVELTYQGRLLDLGSRELQRATSRGQHCAQRCVLD